MLKKTKMEAIHAHTRSAKYSIANLFDTKQNYRTLVSLCEGMCVWYQSLPFDVIILIHLCFGYRISLAVNCLTDRVH